MPWTGGACLHPRTPSITDLGGDKLHPYEPERAVNLNAV